VIPKTTEVGIIDRFSYFDEVKVQGFEPQENVDVLIEYRICSVKILCC